MGKFNSFQPHTFYHYTEKTWVIFIFKDWSRIKIRAKNLIKIAILVTSKAWKTSFDPLELKNTYDYIMKNFKSELNQRDFEKIISIMDTFVDDWWSVQIV